MKLDASSHDVAVAPSILRRINREHVYRTLFETGAITRPKLATTIGLSQPTVTAVLADLEGEGLVRTAGVPESRMGRPAALYEANPAAGAVAAVDIGREWVRVVVADLAGNTLCRTDAKNAATDARGLISLVGTTIDGCVAESQMIRTDITRTVIGSPGVFRPERGNVVHAANLPGWADVDLAAMIVDELGADTLVENDANLAALGEHTHGVGRGLNDFVYLHIGTGVGLGLILNGALYRGAKRSAGEIGYMPLGTGGAANMDRGALEEAIAGDAVTTIARERGLVDVKTSAEVFVLAASGVPAAVETICIEAERIAPLIASIDSMLDPDLIVFGGGVGQNLEALRPDLERALEQLTPLRPEMALGSLGLDAVLSGAVATGVSAARHHVVTVGPAGIEPTTSTV